MGYYIKEESNKYEEEEFFSLLYFACKSDVIKDPGRFIPKYLPLNKEEYYHDGVKLKTVELYYEDAVRQIKANGYIEVDNVGFFRK